MKRKASLPFLLFALVIQLLQGSAGPPSLAAFDLSSRAVLSVAAQPALDLSDLAIATVGEPFSTWSLPPHLLFTLPGTSVHQGRISPEPLHLFVQPGDGARPGDAQVSNASLAGAQHTYFVPFDDWNLWALFEGKASCHESLGPEEFQACLPLMSSVFVTAGADDTRYYYDHWEDGYDEHPLIPSSTTEVGVLDAGATRVFSSDILTQWIGRLVDGEYYYDGRDRITIVGQEANVVRLANAGGFYRPGQQPRPDSLCSPDGGGGARNSSGWLAAAWEVAEVADWGVQYHPAVGEDLDYHGTPDDHDYAGLEIMAAQDGTTVYYTDRSSRILNAGETLFVPGANDGPGGAGVDSSHHITATAPVQVQMMTGACSYEHVSAHGYTLLPLGVWERAYWAPVPGFGLAADGTRGVDTDIYVHNPDPADPIRVTVTSGSRPPLILTVPPDATVSVLRESGWSDLADGNQGTHLASGDVFWGMAVIDSATSGNGNSDDWDWGYSLIPESRLSSQLVVGHAPGKPDQGPDGNPTDNGSLAFVVAVTDTVIYVDLDQDGWPDPFDLDGDGRLDTEDAWGVPEWDECVSALGIPVQAGQVLRVGDPFDRNLEGTRIYTRNFREHIAAAWGEDPNRADMLFYHDLGYTLLPLGVPYLAKTDSLPLGTDGVVGYSPGDIITYTLVVANNGMGTMSDVALTDFLPYTHTDLIVGSVQVTTPPPTRAVEYHDGTRWQTEPIGDAHMLRVSWRYLEPKQMVTVTLGVKVHTAIPRIDTRICNEARVGSGGTAPVDAEICRSLQWPQLSIDKAAFPAQVVPGQQITYTVVVSNDGDGTALPTVISDALPPGIHYVPGTLDLAWPVAQVETVTRVVTSTVSFQGDYADDFDLGTGDTTGYGGNDGSMLWSTDWREVNDDGEPGSGAVQVRVDADNALSHPAFAWLGAFPGGESGLVRTLDLSQFRAPMLRYYPSSPPSVDGDDAYYVTASGTTILAETFRGGYCLRQLDLSDYAGQPEVALGWMVSSGMDPGDYYRLDHIYVCERDDERFEQVVLSDQVTTYAYRSATGQDPLAYDALTRRMVITEGLPLPPGKVLTASFQAQVDLDIPLSGSQWLTNTACVSSTHWLPVLSPPCDDAVVRVQQAPDLEVVKSDEPARYVQTGGVLTYTLAYRNAGAEDARDVVITDVLPDEVTYGGVVEQTAGWSEPPLYDPGPPATLTWHSPALAVGAEGQIVYTVTVDSAFTGTLTNGVCISTTTPETRYDNNCDDEDTGVRAEIVDLAVDKDDRPDPVTPGSLLVYTLAYTNSSPYAAENVVVTDSVPVGTTFVQADPAPISTSDPLTWEVGTLGAEESGAILVTVLVGTQVTQPLTNRACVSTTTPEEVLENNCDDETTGMLISDVAIHKVDDPDPVGRGGRQLVYTLVYTNVGLSTAERVVITDTLPPEATAVQAVPAPAFGSDPLVWNLGDLAPGQGGTVIVTTTLDVSAGPRVNNRAVIDTDTPEINRGNNEDQESTRVEIDLALGKGAPKGSAVGEVLTYTLVYTNHGPFIAREVYITDTLPNEVTYHGAVSAPPGWSQPPVYLPGPQATLTWYRPTLAAGVSGRIVYTVVVDEDAPPQIYNRACVSNAIDDYFEDNNCARVPTAAQLLSFDTLRLPTAVLLKWKTAWEVDSYGFALLRRAGGPQAELEEIAFVPAEGRGGGGAVYRYLDAGPEAGLEDGRSYTYWLVEVDTSGRRTTFGSAVSAADSELPYQVYLPVFWWD